MAVRAQKLKREHGASSPTGTIVNDPAQFARGKLTKGMAHNCHKLRSAPRRLGLQVNLGDPVRSAIGVQLHRFLKQGHGLGEVAAGFGGDQS